MTLNWTTIGTAVSALAGVVGTILTPIYGTQLAGGVQAVLQSVSGLLILIGGYHVTSVAAAKAMAKFAASAPVAAPAAAKKAK
jgi:hypothetical protein